MIRTLLARIPFILAVAFSLAWIVFVVSYAQRLGWAGLMALEPVDFAAYLAGAAGPVAALWLFVAVFEQGRAVDRLQGRLAEMMALSRHSLQQAESQTRTLVQFQAQAGQGASLEARRLAFDDLAANAAVLAERLGVTSRESSAAAWTRYGAGDVTVFVQAFLSFAVSHPDIAERMAEAVARDTLARTALAAFVRGYERLLTTLSDDKLARDVVEEGALGRAFRLFKAADERASHLMAAPAMARPEPVAATPATAAPAQATPSEPREPVTVARPRKAVADLFEGDAPALEPEL